MKKHTPTIFTFFFTLFILGAAYSVPVYASAAETNGGQLAPYQTLVNLPGIGEKFSFGSGSFSNYLNSAFKIGITIAILLAIVMLVIGGIEYMGSEAVWNKEDAKSKFFNAIWGLILALGIFLFLNTINPDLVKFNLEVKKAEVVPGAPAPAVTPAAPSQNDLIIHNILIDEQAIRDKLSSKNVSVNKSACQQVGQKGCTNVGGLSTRAVDGVIAIKTACGPLCVVRITGGTEYWSHSNNTAHRPGNAVVDLGSDIVLNKYISGSSAEQLSGNSYVKNGAYFRFEDTGDNGVSTGKHWHVVF